MDYDDFKNRMEEEKRKRFNHFGAPTALRSERETMSLIVTANVALVCTTCMARRPILFDAAETPFFIATCTCGSRLFAIDRADEWDAEAARVLAELLRVAPPAALQARDVAYCVESALESFRPVQREQPRRKRLVSVIRTPDGLHVEIRPA